MAKLLLERRKRVESGTGTSVPEIRVVGSNLKMSCFSRCILYSLNRNRKQLNLSLERELEYSLDSWTDYRRITENLESTKQFC